jgi:hypothetical protein
MEKLELSNEFAQKFVEEYDLQDLGEVDPCDLAYFVDENWEEITGLPDSEKNEEGYFADEVESICDELQVDMDEFSQEWGILQEGSDDWDLEEEEEYDEEAEDFPFDEDED